jgi:hypothetical protein
MKQISILVVLLFFLSGCYTFHSYKQIGERFSGATEDDFSLNPTIGAGDAWSKTSPYLNISILSRETVINKTDFQNQRLVNIKILLVFLKNNDTLTLVPEKSYINKEDKLYDFYYTCKDFHKKYKRNKSLYLKMEYDLDSLGIIIHKQFEYKMNKQKVTGTVRFG